jgi:micrococcal nuclease
MALRRMKPIIAAAAACLLLAAGMPLAGCSAPGRDTTASTVATSAVAASPPTAASPISAAPLSTSTAQPPTTTSPTTTVGEDAHGAVVRVVDGDTLVVRLFGGVLGATVGGEGETVRLIGIDAPETGEEFSARATEALERLVGGQKVDLALDKELRDQYGRLLAYVFLEDGRMVNAELLREGLATLYTVPPNVRYAEILQGAQGEAQAAGTGIWGGAAPSPLQIVAVNYNPPGDDTLDLNQEYIVFRVLVTTSLAGYAVEDEAGHRFDFPDRIFERGEDITLHSGRGTNTGTDLFWGASGSAIWNNDGDTVKILDPEGHIVASHEY